MSHEFATFGLALWLAAAGCNGVEARHRHGIPQPEQKQRGSSATVDPPAIPTPTSRDRRHVPTRAELLESLTEESCAPGQAPATLSDAIDMAEYDPEDPVDVRSAIAADEDGAFLFLSPDTGESGYGPVRLYRHDGERETEVLMFDTCCGDPSGLRRRLGRYGRYETLPNLNSSPRAVAQFSLDTYSPMVSLAGPLHGWVVWVETTGLEERAQRLHLMRPDGSEDHVLETRPAPIGPCDGDGYSCRNVPFEECDAAALEAEGLACTEPTNIWAVTSSPSGRLLSVTGVVVSAGHGGYTRAQWVVPLPDDVSPTPI